MNKICHGQFTTLRAPERVSSKKRIQDSELKMLFLSVNMSVFGQQSSSLRLQAVLWQKLILSFRSAASCRNIGTTEALPFGKCTIFKSAKKEKKNWVWYEHINKGSPRTFNERLGWSAFFRGVSKEFPRRKVFSSLWRILPPKVRLAPALLSFWKSLKFWLCYQAQERDGGDLEMTSLLLLTSIPSYPLWFDNSFFKKWLFF